MSTAKGSGGPPSPGEEEFEPTAEMMVNDFDDERTLDEEEAMEEADDQQNELSNLEKEKDMPIEALLAMYGYNDGGQENESSSSSEEELLVNQVTKGPSKEMTRLEDELNNEHKLANDEHKEESEDPEGDQPDTGDMDMEDEEEKEPPSMLHQLYKDDSNISSASRHLRSGSRQHSEEEDEEDEDGDYSPVEDDWKKTIMVGSDFQAGIPEGLCKYDDAMPYENEDKLLWDPCSDEGKVGSYLTSIHRLHNSGTSVFGLLPLGAHVRDDEQALYLLLQCGYNTEEALRRMNINSTTAPTSMSLWSEEECRNFETGLRQYGKDFHLIQQMRVRTRSVSELIQFYYLWKKTERHDVFASKARLEKKKYTLHPGTTDFMERFLDEQDSPVSSPNIHPLMMGDQKRQTRTPPLHHSQDSEIITLDESRLLSNHLEDIASHLAKDGLESLVKLAAAAARPPNGISSESHSRTAPFIPSDSIFNHSAAQ